MEQMRQETYSSSSSSTSSRVIVTPTTDADDDDTHTVDTLIIGGGPMGLSTAYHLAQLRNNNNNMDDSPQYPTNIVVVEADPTYSQNCSAVWSAGGIRQQFSVRENIQMGLYARDFLRDAENLLTTTRRNQREINNDDQQQQQQGVNIQFVEAGYLFLTSRSDDLGVQQMRENHKLQTELGCKDHILLDRDGLKKRFPWLNVDDVRLGSFGQGGEGWFDPWAYLQGLRDKTRELGVRHVTGKVVGAQRDPESGRVLSVMIQNGMDRRSSCTSTAITTTTTTMHVNCVVNAAGANARAVLDQLAGSAESPLHHPLPVFPRKRCIFFFHCKPESCGGGGGLDERNEAHNNDEPVIPELAPLTVDSSFVYFRSEGQPGCGNFLCGVSPPEHLDQNQPDPEAVPQVTPDDYHELFEGRIWPALHHRVPAFGNIKLQNAWAGLYEYNTVDQNAILDVHPELPNVYLINGFSGHGLQQSPAAGRAVAELIHYDGHFVSLDLNRFRFDRCLPGGSPIWESEIV